MLRRSHTTILLFGSAFDYSILGGFRVGELFLLASSVILIRQRSHILFCIGALIFLLAYSMWGHFLGYGQNTDRWVFVLKYMVPVFACILGLLTPLDDRFKKVLIGYTICLSVWVIAYPSLIVQGLITGSFRPSFPSDNYDYSDGHLLSATLSTMFIMTLLISAIGLNKPNFRALLINMIFIVIISAAIVLTGSRNGLVLLAMLGIYFMFVRASSAQQKSIPKTFFIILSIIFISWFLFHNLNQLSDNFYKLIARAFNFGFGTDASASGRIVKLAIAINEIENGSIFGHSPFGAKLLWYDSGFAILYSHFGIIGLVMLFFLTGFLLLKVFLKRTIMRDQMHFAFFIICICISNVITEFFLVSRYSIPIFFCVGVYFRHARI